MATAGGLHPCTLAATLFLAPIATTISHILGRILWWGGALSERRAPPHADLVIALAGRAAGGISLPVCPSVCPCCPCYH